jgi:hypothetical protein
MTGDPTPHSSPHGNPMLHDTPATPAVGTTRRCRFDARLFRSAWPVAAIAIVIAGCGAGTDGRTQAAWHAQTDTIGDTIVVRTIAGSEWGSADLVLETLIGALDGADHEIFGEIIGLAVDPRDGSAYIYDRQVPALRRYAADGRYLGTLGRQGGGPGEYSNSDGGLAVLRDGRIVLRDPGNARLSIYDAEGTYVESLPGRGGMFTSTPVFAAADGGFFNAIFQFQGDWTGTRLVRHDASGAAGDTLVLPHTGYSAPQVSASSNGSSQQWTVPFSPRAVWTLHPDGFFVAGMSDVYRIDIPRADGRVLRIMRDVEPVPVSAAERSAEEERVTAAMRNLDPNWRWNGPPMPATKPLYSAIFIGLDGRIWVQLPQPGEPVPEEELEPGPAGGTPPRRFRERAVFDVFDGDGRYLGQVTAPHGFATQPRPVFDRSHVWAVSRDDLGVQYLTRYRIDVPTQ